MTSDGAQGWVLVIAMAISVVVGVLASSTAIRTAWVARAIAAGTIAFLFIGAIMITAPKWNEVAIKFADFEGKISRLNKELETTQLALNDREETIKSLTNTVAELEKKLAGGGEMQQVAELKKALDQERLINRAYEAQVGVLAAFYKEPKKNAAEVMSAIGAVRSKVTWADYVFPSQQSGYAVAATNKGATSLAAALGVETDKVEAVFKANDYTLLQPAQGAALNSAAANQVWINAGGS